jgi:hypothetical protein
VELGFFSALRCAVLPLTSLPMVCPHLLENGAQYPSIQTSPNAHAPWLHIVHMSSCLVLLEGSAKGAWLLLPRSSLGSLASGYHSLHSSVPLWPRLGEGSVCFLLSPNLCHREPLPWALGPGGAQQDRGLAAFSLPQCLLQLCKRPPHPRVTGSPGRKGLFILGWAGVGMAMEPE